MYRCHRVPYSSGPFVRSDCKILFYMAPEKQKKELILPFEMAEAGHDWIFNRIFDHRIHDFMLDNKRNEMTAKLKCIGTQHRSTAGAISTAPGSRTAAAQAEGTRLLLCFVVPSSA